MKLEAVLHVLRLVGPPLGPICSGLLSTTGCHHSHHRGLRAATPLIIARENYNLLHCLSQEDRSTESFVLSLWQAIRVRGVRCLALGAGGLGGLRGLGQCGQCPRMAYFPPGVLEKRGWWGGGALGHDKSPELQMD